MNRDVRLYSLPKILMSLLIKDFYANGDINPRKDFHTAGFVVGIFNLIFLFLGIVLETLVIASILRVRHKSVDNLFVLSLCSADLIYNLYTFPSIMIVMITREWATGKVGYVFLSARITFECDSCKISAAMIILTLSISILSITFITLNRYLAIIWKTNITSFQAIRMIALTWITHLVVIILYASNKDLSESTVALQSSYSYCLLDFISTDPIVITGLITIFIFLSVPLIFMTITYTQIILFYRKMNRSREYVTSEVIRCIGNKPSYLKNRCINLKRNFLSK